MLFTESQATSRGKRVSRTPPPARRSFASTLREQIARVFFDERPGGFTPSDICARFSEVHDYTVRPRVSELKKQGLLAPTGIRRENERKSTEEVLRWAGPSDFAQVRV